uniref:Ig-like domain-containing protein n=1 Tax=Neolamprologus brichardi TaxID=32507 RepID=A0A3Q4MS30_NEOBR
LLNFQFIFKMFAVILMIEKTVHAGNSVTLHCSLFSDAENKTCPGGHHVFWFREGSHPDIIYTEGNRHHECEKNTEAQRSCKTCVYRFSKNVSSSDAGTYYCAVATCGEILFGSGAKLDIQAMSLLGDFAVEWWNVFYNPKRTTTIISVLSILSGQV